MKERLDVLLVRQGFYETREKAKRAVMAGLVFVDGQLSDKPGTPTKEEAVIAVKGAECPYVGRGGFKLAKALETFGISVDGLVCADIGASTGGFTDCMLQNGASKVYAIDVGYGQLDYKLRIDPRVVNLEKTNIRYFDPETIEPVSFLSIDVSFISTNLVFPVAARMLKENGTAVSLVKPQFEAGREEVGKHGIVSDPRVHESVIRNVIGYAENAGLAPAGLTFSPIAGAKGNIEYLLYLRKTPVGTSLPSDDLIASTVSEAHHTLR